ncbi:MAG: tetratricopeptide repeat protein [Mogibacterium sp.]|nr:tetratricopeptide repeat protein [Mogibacterium sp.]
MDRDHEKTEVLLGKELSQVDTETLVTEGVAAVRDVPGGVQADAAAAAPRTEAPGEQTGELMAQGRKQSGKTVLLVVLAVLVVIGAAVAFLNRGGSPDGGSGGGSGSDGSGGSGGTGASYEDYLSLGEKYFAEGNYEQAEVNFLSALGMKPREPRAQRGLAYTYAVQGKFADAKTVYDELYEDTGEEIYATAAAEVADNRVPTNIDLIPVPPEYAELTRTAFAEHAGTYYYDFAGGEYWPVEYTDAFELITWWSYVMVTLNEDGSFTVLTNQYEAFTDIHVGGADEVRRAEAVGQFICVGQNDDGAYILRLVALNGTTQDSDEYNWIPYYDPIDGQDYELPTTYRAFNPEQGFANAGEFLLSDGTLVNVGGSQTFTSTWNHAIGE